MGSRGALLGLSLTAVALAVALILGRGAGHGDATAYTTRIVPEAGGAPLEAITWRRAGTADVVVRGERIAAPVDAAVEPDVLADVRGALELLSFARVGDGRDVQPEVVVMASFAGHAPIELRIGAAEGQSGRRWVQRAGGPAYLVDAWAARALDLTLDDLRATRVFRTRGLSGVEIDAADVSVILVGARLDVRVGEGTARAAPARLLALRGVLRDTRLARFLDVEPPVGDSPALQVRTLGEHAGSLALYGPCPADAAQRLAVTSLGVGCVSNESAAAATALAQGVWIDDALLPRAAHDVSEVRSGDVHVVRRGASWRFADTDEPADAAAVQAWLAALANAEVTQIVPGTFEMAATAQVDGAVLAVDASGSRVRRDDEAVVLVLAQPADLRADFRPRQVMAFEPSALRAVSRDGRWVRRGETLADWPDARNPTALLAFRDVASRLRAESFTDDELGTGVIAFELEFDAEPGGEPTRRTIDIDRACRARVQGSAATVQVSAPDCRALRAAW